MTLKKRLLKSAPVIWLGSQLLALWLRFVYATSRVEKQCSAESLPYMGGEKTAIFCFWHGRMVMQPFTRPKGRRLAVLISRHADGRMISAIVRRLSIETVHGSRGKGVRPALEGMLGVLKEGGNVAITPDGPRGPQQKAAEGAAYVALQSGMPIIGTSFASTKHIRFKTWDRFMLPKPFGRIVFVIAAPIFLSGESSDEAIATGTQIIEQALNSITVEADRLCGVTA